MIEEILFLVCKLNLRVFFAGYILRPAIQLKATMDAMNPTKLKNYGSENVREDGVTAVREYALSSSGVLKDENIRRKFGSCCQL